jgi:hypothetical protein
MKSCLAV